ncbi:voltage-gated potassium channel [Pelagimonas phthalicica]|uniref:Voltage-gated potassium channel n=1 Tax=Pelagimonas phthalicica TaxID=1037362 RepID=A0A238JEV5_9RHOB|nr:potassium channel family protein [Pelagimonas phthalicica]TDS91318.1 voltage-gated potassium channel [Pelagimonas phthalicica]SMX28366.1 voltage-gated potassium channel [Pelagimonas phthalicica]
MTHYRALTLLGMLFSVVAVGTVFFHYAEGWSWLDSYFFTVVTLSTVGYGELVPATPIGKIGTTVFIFVGLGIFAVAIQQFGHYAIRRREQHSEILVASLGKEETAANDDFSEEKPSNDRSSSH